VRSLYEIAVEGCVRETFGALEATFQAKNANDPQIRRVMRRIAEDETRHAALAWRVAAWIEPRLSDRQRRRRCAPPSRSRIFVRLLSPERTID